MKRLKYVSIVFLFLSLLHAEEIITLGEEDNWQGGYFLNLIEQQGRQGYLDLQVSNTQLSPQADRDFLFNFEAPLEEEISGLYRLINKPEVQQQFSRRGQGAAYFTEDKYLELQPLEGSQFYPREPWEDFTIEFWLYPANLQEGEILLKWKGFLQENQRILSQEVSCTIKNRSLHWEFINFFLSHQREETLFQLQGDRLIPRRWSHHMLRYNSQLGLLEYLIDGKPSQIIHTTATRREEGDILLPRIEQPQPTPLIIGEGFTGFMDELSLSRSWKEPPVMLDYQQPGYYISPVLDFHYQDSSVEDLIIHDNHRDNSRISYYYYITNHRSQALQERSQLMNREKPEFWLDQWQPLENATLTGKPLGRYMMVLAILYPDLGVGFSPSLSSFEIHYEEHLPPLAPLNLRAAVLDDGRVHLTWDYSENSGISGFQIYYGDRPGSYFGAQSPLEVEVPAQEFYLEGLESHKTWYISMVAYNDSSPPQYSNFSLEVAVRP
ncbi:MAG: fibronectin type III domain-containing protein [Spirochaetaceae bacterium]|nr:fibronectin type III domain-containing protein [Spirochaetaceae bacterium]